jgi:endonuclease/exonuclease/phosphatase family metal-dependent hydrolase
MRVFSRLVLLLALPVLLGARPFSVVVYNVENLFDIDGVAQYDDYQPDRYGPAHLATKLTNIADIMTRFGDGAGPDVILFQEIEVDQTPGPRPPDYDQLLRLLEGRMAVEWLADETISPRLRDLPAEAWLLKALQDAGLTGYRVATGRDGRLLGTEGFMPAVKNVTFSRFPITRTAYHASPQARVSLETELDVEGHPFIVFNVHWKSGASNPDMEAIRLGNAQVIRDRLNEIFAADPNADVLLGGDFNSQYNQNIRYRRDMPRTGLNHVLGSQGNELALRGRDRDLYNLWFELPSERRGSDVFRGEWGTLMQMIISRGLYDRRGVQYQDNSFGVARFPGMNVDDAGAPIRWSWDGPGGGGYSDHLPIYAHFRVVEDNRPDRWIELVRPSEVESDGVVHPVSYAHIDLSGALRSADLPAGANLRDGSWSGRLFRVEGASVPHQYPRVLFADEEYEIYGTDQAIRAALYQQRDRLGHFAFHGQLGTYRGRWQFVVRDLAWIAGPASP